MKIIHFSNGRCNPDSANGVEKTIWYLAVNQALLGHEVHVFSISEKSIIRIPGVNVKHFRSPRYPWLLSELLWGSILDIAPDLVHIHCMYLPQNVVLGNRLRRAGIAYIVTPHGNCSDVVMRRRPYLKYPYKILFERPYMNHSLAVHSVGDTESIKEYGIKVPIIIAPNGVDRGSIPTGGRSNPVLISRPGWADRTIFLYVGRLDTVQKGLDIVIKGFAKALETEPKMGLVLVGPDWKNNQRRLVSLVAGLGIDSSVYFAGAAYGQEKYDYLYSSDYFVHTSRWEGLPFSVVEALACGIPCIVTPAANPAGLIGFFHAGREVEPDARVIAQSFVDLSGIDAQERLAMAGAAKDLIDAELLWINSARKLTNGCIELLQKQCPIQ